VHSTLHTHIITPMHMFLFESASASGCLPAEVGPSFVYVFSQPPSKDPGNNSLLCSFSFFFERLRLGWIRTFPGGRVCICIYVFMYL
jgi:hypothetical protein